MDQIVSKILLKLKDKDIHIWVEDNSIRFDAPEGAMTDEIVSLLKTEKRRIIEALKRDRLPKDNMVKKIKQVNKQDNYMLSHAQKRLWILNQFDKDSIAYNIPSSFIYKGKLDFESFNHAFSVVIGRHESLRTVFITVDGEPRQKILENPDFGIEIINLTGNTDAEEESQFLAEKDLMTPFNLERGPLVRFSIIQIEEEKSLFLFNMHHIISDGWSVNIFISEFLDCYHSYRNGDTPNLKPLEIQYKDYTEWHNDLIANSEMDNQREYWLDKLSGELPVLDLPADNARPIIKSYNGNNIDFVLSEEMSSSLNDLCLENKSSLNMMLQALVKVLFYKYTGQEDIILGSLVAGRVHKDIENQIGFYVNTLVFRDTIKGDLTFKEFLASVKKTCTDAFDNQDYPFDCLVEELDIKKDPSRSPIFDAGVVLQNNEITEVEFDGLNLLPNNTENKISKFDISFNFTENSKGLFCSIEYNTDIYSEDRIKRMTEHLKILVSSVIEGSESRIKDLEIIPVEEKNLLLNIFNNTKTDYPADKTIIDLFEEQVYKTPDNIAVVFEDVKLTYKELNEKANNIGHYLRHNYEIKPDDLVGVLLEKSEKMIITILGILKSGAAYVPLDPESPEERLGYMLEDSEATIIITSKKILKKHSFSYLQEHPKVQVVPTISKTRMPIEDLIHHPIPDRSLVDYEKYSKYCGEAMVSNAITIQATRGCPYQCIYCHKIWPKTHIVRSAEHIFDEVLIYYKMGVRRFSFIDDIFNLNVKNSTRFFELIIKNKLNVQLFFANGMRGDLLTQDYIDLMVKAGVVELALALESASPRLQKLMKKNLNIIKLKENIEYIAHNYPQVILSLFTMHGFPTESEEEAESTLNFIKSIKWIHFPYVHVLKIYPGSDMAKLAIEEGVSQDAISRSFKLAYHELPETLPFDKDFTLKYQAEFLSKYFLNKERLLAVLPYQLKILTEDEIVQKYNSYLPYEINSVEDIFRLADIEPDELSESRTIQKNAFSINDFNMKLKEYFPEMKPDKNALRVLFLDLSQLFLTNSNKNMDFDLVEPPLGLMYLLTYLNKKQGNRINGKIAKSMIDFANYNEFKVLLEDFKPDVICIRTLSFYKDFFHEAIAKIRLWGIDVPIITGGPYGTSSYETILQDRNIDLVVLGEGEVTLNELISRIIDNEGRLPADNILSTIKGIAYIPDNKKRSKKLSREVLLEEDLSQFLPQQSNINLLSINNSNDLAYAIYTSGSTGIPKGTLVEHKSVIRLIKNTNYISINTEDRIYQTGSLSFDASTFEIWGSLLNGAGFYLSKDILDISKVADDLRKNNITILWLTARLFDQIVSTDISFFKPIKTLLIGGDKLSAFHVNKVQMAYPELSIINGYGPTENTTFTCCFIVDKYYNTDIPIGSPISNTTVYILDKDKNPAPIGVPGELCISGDGLARGYLNKPELTAVKFVENPLVSGQRMYRTGDIARWLTDGNIEFLGRIDNQVKIRGFRIELGEIENSLVQHNDINSAVVVAIDGIDGDRQLVAYYISDSELEVSDIQCYMKISLPEYMIPSHFIHMDTFPLTSNGKIDRKVLSESDVSINTGVEYIAPRDDIEKKLVEIWQEVLGVKKIGVQDNFFKLGGHSLKIVQVISRIKEKLLIDIKMNDIYERSTISELAGRIHKVGSSELEVFDNKDEIGDIIASIRQ